LIDMGLSILHNFWDAALKAEVGIAIQTDNRGLLRQHLYRCRAELNDPKLDKLSILLPEKEDELWIVHNESTGGAPNQGYPKLIYP